MKTLLTAHRLVQLNSNSVLSDTTPIACQEPRIWTPSFGSVPLLSPKRIEVTIWRAAIRCQVQRLGGNMAAGGRS